MEALLNTLAGVHPLLPWSILTLAIWLGAYAVRKFAPALWRVPALLSLRDQLLAAYPQAATLWELAWGVWQALPSVGAGALLGAWQLGTEPGAAWKGAIAGAIAPLWHHAAKALPWLPYLGRLGKVRLPRLPMLIFALLAGACAAINASTVRDARRVIAELLCARENAPRLGLSVEDVRRGYCAADAVIGPYLDRVERAPDESVGLATQAVGACPEK
jgi:hypothetical protein